MTQCQRVQYNLPFDAVYYQHIWAEFSSFPILFNKINESQKALDYVLWSKLFFQAIDDIFGNSQFLKIV